jgi:hypothetical protein
MWSPVGAACSHVGPYGNAPGVCTKSTCYRTTPDGKNVAYDCGHCELKPKDKSEARPKK